jgi:hypothetical protein
MILLYKYIFCKAYYFCINVYKDREFPYFFAAGAISMTFVGTIILTLELISYVMLPTEVNTYGKYYGYFSVSMLIITSLYVKKNNRYLKIIQTCKDMSRNTPLVLRYISIAYILGLLISLCIIATLHREYLGAYN